MPEIVPFDPAAEAALVAELYDAALAGGGWAADRAQLAACLAAFRSWAVRDRAGLAGIASAAHAPGAPTAFVTLLVVRPDRRRTGIGTRLLEHAAAALTATGARRLELGGGRRYLWPGVPDDLQAAHRFAAARGFTAFDRRTDLLAPVDGIGAHGEVARRLAACPATVRPAAAADAARLLRFEQEHFPQWAHVAEDYAAGARLDRVLLAEQDGELVGSAFLAWPPADPPLFDALARVGEVGAIGVRADARRHSIGAALTLTGCAALRAAGVEACRLGWVFSSEYYAQLGFARWRSYTAYAR